MLSQNDNLTPDDVARLMGPLFANPQDAHALANTVIKMFPD